uniref:Natural cytotoxicity triggering receptor 2 n=2 Tax=Camelus TaxID=9836 RepID=A0A516MWP6_CAMBA|nr:natural cytotoxicity triggering receptor 2 [Camelus dromedarius]QDP71068.1 natural cytotoxicity triggering receptor 2 [Camelus bactrianus]QDP71060.1 natural cytotoxicity triggering receptor 2 [Camelus dromedarius]QDP71061.1 natural cytotoxicity triggering receptor 2 [Camelus dromedarius]QDP71062.1 natural cytotoxicity triggering receptor 2 [Camelus dromedarius]
MSFPAGTLSRVPVAWRAPLPLLLLLLPFPGSWALPGAQHLQSVAGQTLSVRCQYPPKSWPYEKKGWCKEVSPLKCMRLVTSSSPHTLVQASRFSIWDNPDEGFFIVTMTGLREEDSGHYWCRNYHASSHSVSKSLKFYLAVSPASASMQATWAPHDLVSQTESCVSSKGAAREAPRASTTITALSLQQNSTLWSSPAASRALVPVLCGLLVAKSLVLSALLVQPHHVSPGHGPLCQSPNCCPAFGFHILDCSPSYIPLGNTSVRLHCVGIEDQSHSQGPMLCQEGMQWKTPTELRSLGHQ